MARIALADIPNAPQVGQPVGLANPKFPTDEVGGMAQRAIAQGYEANMVNPRAAAAQGEALESVGNNITRTAVNLMGTAEGFGKMASAEAKNQFLFNLQSAQQEVQAKTAGAPPEMYPTIVAETYGQNNERLYAGISNYGRQFVQGLALREGSKDMAEASNKAHVASIEQENGKQFAAMQGYVNTGQFDKADEMLENMITLGRVSAQGYAAQKVAIAGSRDTSGLQSAIARDPVGWEKKITQSILSGEPLKEFSNIAPSQLPSMARIAKTVNDFQLYEKQDTVRAQIDANQLATVDAIKANPVFKTLPTELQEALVRRRANNISGTEQADNNRRYANQLIARFPETENASLEHLKLQSWMIEHVPSPQFEAMSDALHGKLMKMAQNGGQLPTSSKLEQQAAKRLKIYADSGAYGQMPDSKMKGTPAYAAAMFSINDKMDSAWASIRSEMKKTGAQTPDEVRSIVDQQLSGDEAARVATLAGKKGFFRRAAEYVGAAMAGSEGYSGEEVQAEEAPAKPKPKARKQPSNEPLPAGDLNIAPEDVPLDPLPDFPEVNPPLADEPSIRITPE